MCLVLLNINCAEARPTLQGFIISYLGGDKSIEAILKSIPSRGRLRLRYDIPTITSWLSLLRLLRLRWFKSLQRGRREQLLFAGRERILRLKTIEIEIEITFYYLIKYKSAK